MKTTLISITLSSLVSLSISHAATYVWTGNSDGTTWSDSGNWQKDGSPSSDYPINKNTVRIDNGDHVKIKEPDLAASGVAYFQNNNIYINNGSSLTIDTRYLYMTNSHFYVSGEKGLTILGKQGGAYHNTASKKFSLHLGTTGSVAIERGGTGGAGFPIGSNAFYMDIDLSLDIVEGGSLYIEERTLFYGLAIDGNNINTSFPTANISYILSGYDNFTRVTSGDLDISDGEGAWQTYIDSSTGDLKIKYVTGTFLIPEPMTATITLLGLGLLASRRKTS